MNCCFVSDIRFQVLTAVAMNVGMVLSGIGRHVIYITNEFYTHGTVHRKSVSINIQRDATIHSLFLYVLLTVHLSIILVTNQLNAQILVL